MVKEITPNGGVIVFEKSQMVSGNLDGETYTAKLSILIKQYPERDRYTLSLNFQLPHPIIYGKDYLNLTYENVQTVLGGIKQHIGSDYMYVNQHQEHLSSSLPETAIATVEDYHTAYQTSYEIINYRTPIKSDSSNPPLYIKVNIRHYPKLYDGAGSYDVTLSIPVKNTFNKEHRMEHIRLLDHREGAISAQNVFDTLNRLTADTIKTHLRTDYKPSSIATSGDTLFKTVKDANEKFKSYRETLEKKDQRLGLPPSREAAPRTLTFPLNCFAKCCSKIEDRQAMIELV